MINKMCKEKVFCAMSGGVDSSVAAFLLKQKGYDVTGVYMKNWSEESFGGKFSKYCPWRKDLKDVKNVCKILGIPFKVYNFEKEYNKKVINYFFKGEKRGLTPNPDVVCNREIKFGLFLKKALKDGADYIATGHYIKKRALKNNKHEIISAKDVNKDQSYFLCTLTQKQLSKALFPLGDYTKPEVRKIAKSLKFSNADKEESMGICFVGEVDFEEFLKARLKEKHGPIVDVDGTKIGRHKGLPFYTIGQRKGINIGGGLPYFVVGKDLKKNQLIVGRGSKARELYQKVIKLKNVTWQAGSAPKFPVAGHALIRYRQKQQPCVILKQGIFVLVQFKQKQRAVTPGQFCAMYKKSILLGGGEIQ